MLTKKLFYICLSSFILFCFCSCTVIGKLAGSKIDANKAVLKYPKLEKLEKVGLDTLIKITLRDDQNIEGRFQGIEYLDSSEYIQRYNLFRAGLQNKIWFPDINDTIYMYDQYGTRIKNDNRKFIFSGFDLTSISFRFSTGADLMSMKLKEFELIVGKKRDNLYVQGIKDYLEKGILPLRSELVIHTAAGVQKIPLEKILELKLPKTNKWNNTLGTIGLVTDVVWIIIAGTTLQNFGSGWGSAY